METDLAETKTDTQEVNKYDVLQKKEQEMNEFMENFEETKEKEISQIEDLEKTIPALLEHMSAQYKQSTSLPSRSDVKEDKDMLKFQEKEGENSENTAARIRVELETRQHDFEKIQNLEQKIEKENKTMNEKLEKMEDEMKNVFP